MRKTFLILLLILLPTLVYGFTASDFIVNNQSTYSIPPGTTKVLILDLTLPEPLESIKIKNAGTAQQTDVTKISVFEDGSSPGWDGDESERVRKSSSPFFDTELIGDFSSQRIFVTMDIASAAVSERTIKPKAVIGSLEITGLEREILAGASLPTVPVSPLAKSGQALSTSTIRWHFTDLSNNEFGFKIFDENLNEVARNEAADISYVDETGLTPDTEYSGRRVVAFNDRGESLGSSLAVFPAIYTLAPLFVEAVEEVVEEVPEEVIEAEEAIGGPFTVEDIKAKIIELQQKVIELLNQLIELLQQQLVKVRNFLASLWITLF